MGLEKTRIRRMLFDRSAAALGKQNSISPKELGLLLERLYRGEFVSREVSDYAIKGSISIDLFIDYEKPFISDDPKEVFDWMKSTSKESEHINKNSYHPLRIVAVFACAHSYIPF